MRTSVKLPYRLIAAALAALQLCAGAAGAVFDNSFSYTYSLGSGLQYSRTEGKNSAGLQRANVLTYSPNTGVTPLMVYADEQLYGSKATITNAVKYLQNQGKTVLGGINADFFVMSPPAFRSVWSSTAASSFRPMPGSTRSASRRTAQLSSAARLWASA